MSRTLAGDAGPPPVDLPRLVVLVRGRRVLRSGFRLALLALPVWFAVIVSVIEARDEGSATRSWVEDHADRGFVIILAVLAVDLVLSAVLRRVGDAGALAARLVPMVRAVPDPVIRTAGGVPGADRLLDVGSRPRRSRAPEISWWATAAIRVSVVLLVVVILIPASMIRAQYRAAQGEGGPVVTVGEDSRIARTVEGPDDDSYYLTSPLGEALVDGARKPDAGNRFVVIETVNGRQAVPVGGHGWIISLVVTVIGSLLACVVLYLFVRRLAARRPDERIVPLAATVDELTRGEPVAVDPVPWRGRSRVEPAAALTVSADRGAAAVVDRVRRHSRQVTAGLVAVLVLTGSVVAGV